MPDLRRLPRRAALALTGAVALASASTLVYAAVVVQRDHAQLRLAAAPAARTVAPGHTARFAVRVRRTRFAGTVRLRVLGTVPAGVTTTLSGGRRRSCATTRRCRHRVCWFPTAARQTWVTLTVRTTSAVRTGTYRLRLQGVRYGGRTSAKLSVFVVVRRPAAQVVGGASGPPTAAPAGSATPATPPAPAPAPASASAAGGGTPAPPGDGSEDGPVGASGGDEGEPFPIRGDVTGLAPGVSRPIDLELSNDQDDARLVTALGVTQGEVTAPNADLEHPCTTADFAVVPMPAGAFPIVLPPGTHRLSALGVPAELWPRLTMLARPVNQDGCQRASQQLRFTGQTTDAP